MLILHSALLLSEFTLNSDRALPSTIQKEFAVCFYILLLCAKPPWGTGAVHAVSRLIWNGNLLQWNPWTAFCSSLEGHQGAIQQDKDESRLIFPSTELKQKLQKHFWLLAVVTHSCSRRVMHLHVVHMLRVTMSWVCTECSWLSLTKILLIQTFLWHWTGALLHGCSFENEASQAVQRRSWKLQRLHFCAHNPKLQKQRCKSKRHLKIP